VGSKFDDWIYWKSLLQLHLSITIHTFNSFLITDLSPHFFWFSDWSLVFYYSVRLSSYDAFIHQLLELLYDWRFTAKSVRLGDKPLETHDQKFYFLTESFRLQSLRNILSDERIGLSFTIVAGSRQRSHSEVRVPRDSWPHFTVSDADSPKFP
jgi:hypothetical protein